MLYPGVPNENEQDRSNGRYACVSVDEEYMYHGELSFDPEAEWRQARDVFLREGQEPRIKTI
jgi:hypothetical protein